ncbi:MAG: hypothetical protein WCX46_04575 [Candidatus Paceibacterota bacterium]
MKLSIPLGSEIDTKSNEKTIKIRVPNTNFWVIGEKIGKKWNAFLFDPSTNQKSMIRKEATTESFAIFSNVILKTPFPYQGKKKFDIKVVRRFIKKITKNI